MLDGGQCVHVACEVGEFRNVTLHAVEQCVEPLVCREFRRHGEHQLRIDYGQYGKSGFDADLFMGLFVGYDSPRVDFRPGSCRRGYGDERQRCVSGLLFFARPAENVVPQVAVVGCHQGYGLRGVHDAAASQCDDHVAPVLPCRCRSGHDGGFQGVRFDPVEYHAFDPCQPELFLRGGQIAVCSGRLAVRNCQQRLFSGHLLPVQVFQFVRPEKDAGRDPHVEIQFCFHGSIVFDVFSTLQNYIPRGICFVYVLRIYLP